MPSKNIIPKKRFQRDCVLKGLLCAVLLTITLSLAISLLLQFTPLSESLLPRLSSFIFLMSMLFGAVISARAAGSMGLFHGLTVSLLYWLVTLIISLIWGLEAFALLDILKRLALSLTAGVVGGITGIGLSEK